MTEVSDQPPVPLSRPVFLATLAIRQVRKNPEKAAEWLALAEQEAPRHPAVVATRMAFDRRTLPVWHFPMLFDEERNRAYQAAIAALVRPGMRVLEIGTGSGLLAMMAARAGAAQVVTIEADTRLAEAARTIIAANGLADRITVITGLSTDQSAQMIGGRADLLVTEIFGATLVQERALPSIAHARAALLSESAPIIPAVGAVRIGPVLDRAVRRGSISDVCGFDLSGFNAFLAPAYGVKSSDPDVQLSGPADTLFSFDFQNNSRFPPAERTVSVMTDGRAANALAIWLRLDLAPGIVFENWPESAIASHWGIQISRLARPIASGPPTAIHALAAHDVEILHLWPLD